MIPTSTAILVTNGLTLRKSMGLWIYPSQAKQLELLYKLHDIKIVERTLRYHHLNHRNRGLTVSRRRWKRRKDGTVYIQTTARAYTISGYRDLLRLGHTWAQARIQRLIQKYGPESDSAKKPVQEVKPTTIEQLPVKPGKSPFEDPEFRKKRGLPEKPPYKV